MNELEQLEQLEQQFINDIENSMSEVIYQLENDNLEKAAYMFNEFESVNFELLQLWDEHDDLSGFGYAYNWALGEGQHTIKYFLEYLSKIYDLDLDNFEDLREQQINY